MDESFWGWYDIQQTQEGIKEVSIPSFSDSENLVKNDYLQNKDREWSQELAQNQLNENNALKTNIETQWLSEVREELDKQAMINEAKVMLYEKLGLDDNQNNNSSIENFEKWIVDELVLNNYDLAIQVWETNWAVILEGLKQLASWEWIKQMAQAIWESFTSLFTGNAYEKWKSVAELWLIWTWVWAGVYLWKKWVKLWMKEISKLRVKKENLVSSIEVKEVIWDVHNKLDDILPKKELDFEAELNRNWVDNKEIIDWDIQIIDRQDLVEDLPRIDVELRKITEFPEITDKQLTQIEIELKDVIWSVKYNSFEKIEQLFKLYMEKKWDWYSIVQAYNEIDFNYVDIWKWSNCVGMSCILKDNLSELWIKSHLIRFDAGGLVNNDYVVNWHSALIIPSKINWEKHFTLADPWMLIPKTFTFADWKVSKPFTVDTVTYVVHTEVKDWLPYMLDINSAKKLYFDPYNEWINPWETLNKDIMRALWDFKIVQQNAIWKPDAFITNLVKWEIKLKLWDSMMKLSYKEFLQIKNNPELYELFSWLIKGLWEKPEDFFNVNKDIIEWIWEYKDKIWAPSTKKIIDLKNNNN